MNDVERKYIVLRILRAGERWWGENGMQGEFRDELENIARDVCKRLSKNQRALDSIAADEAPWDEMEVGAWCEFVPKDKP